MKVSLHEKFQIYGDYIKFLYFQQGATLDSLPPPQNSYGFVVNVDVVKALFFPVMWHAIRYTIISIKYEIHFQSERFSEVEVSKSKPKEVITAAQVVQDVKEERFQTPNCVTGVTCQHKGTTLLISE